MKTYEEVRSNDQWGDREHYTFPDQAEVEEARALYCLLQSRLDAESGDVTIGVASPAELEDGKIEHIERIDAGGDAPDGVMNIKIRRSMMKRLAWMISVVAEGRQTHSFSVLDYMSVWHAASYLRESEETIMELIDSGKVESAEWEGEKIVKTESLWAHINEKIEAEGRLRPDIMWSRIDEDTEYREKLRLAA